jgi:hypothetical protein
VVTVEIDGLQDNTAELAGNTEMAGTDLYFPRFWSLNVCTAPCYPHTTAGIIAELGWIGNSDNIHDIFSYTTAGFEPAPTPLPAPLPLFATGLSAF